MGRTATSHRSLAKKRSVDLSGYQKFWPMRQQRAGVNDNAKIVTEEVKVHKCMECGAETDALGDYGGEPDLSKCTRECRAHTKSTRAASRVTDSYRDRYNWVNWRN